MRPPPQPRRSIIAFAFDLVHGFGFSFVLSETLQFAGSHLLTSLLAFTLGVELGQVLVILLVVPLLNLAGMPAPNASALSFFRRCWRTAAGTG